MKKILFLLLGVLGVALPAGAEEHKIEMVTYFPVPYVAYSQIKPTKQLDVGTATACEMNLGCAESGDAGVLPLSVTGNMYLKKGRLDFNSAAAVYSNVVRLGNGIGAANLDFGSNLRVGAINNGYTLEADQTTVDTLDLFPGRIKNSFPSCAAVGGTSSISWQELQLKDRKETYLMCGTPKELPPVVATCSDRSYKLAHKSECCPSAPQKDKDCWTEQFVWSGVTYVRNDQAIYRCNQQNQWTPYNTCASKCMRESPGPEGDPRCASLKGPCYRLGETCLLDIGYCPTWTGRWNMAEPICDCKGGELLGKTYNECIRTYVRNGW